MNKTFLIIGALLLSACSTTKLSPVLYMPEPPEKLMKPARQLNTIKPQPTETTPAKEEPK